MAAGTYPLTARATDNSGLTTTSSGVEVNVHAPVVASAPQIDITSPAFNSTFTALATITITATATDNLAGVKKVEFFAGNTKLGEDLTSPYSFTWNNVPAGAYALTAKATNTQDIATTSARTEITVVNPVLTARNYNLTAYPNPFQQYITIEFVGVEKENASLQIFNLQGILLETLYRGKVEAGTTYSFKFEGSNYPTGTYVSRLVCGKNVFSKLIILTR
jgi:hypothetical protein